MTYVRCENGFADENLHEWTERRLYHGTVSEQARHYDVPMWPHHLSWSLAANIVPPRVCRAIGEL